MDDYSNRPHRPISLNLSSVAGPTIQWFEAATKVSEELSRFANERTKRNLETWEQMTQCGGSPLRLFEIHQDWIKGTLRDYLEENRRIMNMAGEVMQHSHEAENTAGDMLREARARAERNK